MPYRKLFPKCTKEEYEKVWTKMDTNGDGVLQFEELAQHYGFKLDMKVRVFCVTRRAIVGHPALSCRQGHRKAGGESMTDAQIMEALQMQAALASLQEEQDKKRQAALEKKALEKAGNRRTRSPALELSVPSRYNHPDRSRHCTHRVSALPQDPSSHHHVQNVVTHPRPILSSQVDPPPRPWTVSVG